MTCSILKGGILATSLIAMSLPGSAFSSGNDIEALRAVVEDLQRQLAEVKTQLQTQAKESAKKSDVSDLKQEIKNVSSRPATAKSIKDRIHLSGFMSAGATRTNTETKYVGRFDEDVNYTDTRLGLNLSVDITDKLGLAGQVLMAGREDSWNAHADWVFASYRPTDDILLMGGRIKYPNLLFSEFYDVGKVYPWLRAPEELYGFGTLGGNMSYEVFSGVSAAFSGYMGDFEWQLQPYMGVADMEFAGMKDMYGLAASVGTDEYQVKIGYNTGEYNFGGGGHGGGGADELTELLEHNLKGQDKKVSNIGFIYDANDILVLAEWAKTNTGGVGAEGYNFDTKAWYGTVGYRFDKWLPYVTYAEYKQKTGSEQDRLALGLNYDLDPSATLKFEWQQIKPTSGEEIEFHDEEVGHPVGLFDGNPNHKKVQVFGVSIDYVF
jgi:hypothetical protein